MKETQARQTFLPPAHNHGFCSADALARATEVCRARGVRLTRQRREVLKLVWSSHRPVGAYELIEAMSSEGARCAPPTVYRALQFLMDNGLVHRIESLNAFVGCDRSGDQHTPQFLICESCRNVGELHDADISLAIQASARAVGFRSRHACIEVTGLCPACDRSGAGAASR